MSIAHFVKLASGAFLLGMQTLAWGNESVAVDNAILNCFSTASTNEQVTNIDNYKIWFSCEKAQASDLVSALSEAGFTPQVDQVNSNADQPVMVFLNTFKYTNDLLQPTAEHCESVEVKCSVVDFSKESKDDNKGGDKEGKDSKHNAFCSITSTLHPSNECGDYLTVF